MGYGVKQDMYNQGLVHNQKEVEINDSESDLSGALTIQRENMGSSRRSRRSVESVTSKGIHTTQPMEVIKE
jgi:hypothetical protein